MKKNARPVHRKLQNTSGLEEMKESLNKWRNMLFHGPDNSLLLREQVFQIDL